MTEPFDADLWRREAARVARDVVYHDTYVHAERLARALNALDQSRAALAWYADSANYSLRTGAPGYWATIGKEAHTSWVLDEGRRARAAIAATEGEVGREHVE